MKTINATLLAAIKKSGLTHYALAKLASIGQEFAVSPATIDRFVSGVRSNIRLETAAKLCTALGLELRPVA